MWHVDRDAYSSGHLVPSHYGLTYALLVTNTFLEFIVIFHDYAIQTSLGTFSIFLIQNLFHDYLGNNQSLSLGSREDLRYCRSWPSATDNVNSILDLLQYLGKIVYM